MGMINDTVEMRTDFRQHEYAFWREYMRWMIGYYDDDRDVSISGEKVNVTSP